MSSSINKKIEEQFREPEFNNLTFAEYMDLQHKMGNWEPETEQSMEKPFFTKSGKKINIPPEISMSKKRPRAKVTVNTQLTPNGQKTDSETIPEPPRKKRTVRKLPPSMQPINEEEKAQLDALLKMDENWEPVRPNYDGENDEFFLFGFNLSNPWKQDLDKGKLPLNYFDGTPK